MTLNEYIYLNMFLVKLLKSLFSLDRIGDQFVKTSLETLNTFLRNKTHYFDNNHKCRSEVIFDEGQIIKEKCTWGL